MNIGQRIKARREELGLTQGELSKKMGYKTRNAIYQYEQVDNMKLSLVEKFAEALDCSEAYLMGWEEELPDTDTVADLLLDYPEVFDDREFLLMYADMTDDEKSKVKAFAKFVLSLR